MRHIRISIKWFHLDIGMIGKVTIFDNLLNEIVGEWNVEVDEFTRRHYPEEPDRTLPPAHEKYIIKVSEMIDAYMAGYRKEENFHQWHKGVE